MARYSAGWSGVTCVTAADAGVSANTQYPGTLRGGSATTLARINEAYIGGEDTASTPTTLILARASTLSVGALSVGTNALVDVQSTAPGTLMSWGNTAATSGPARSATLYLLNLSLNTYGGIARWQARYGEEITVYGASANIGEAVLSSKVGTGKSSGHILYELV